MEEHTAPGLNDDTPPLPTSPRGGADTVPASPPVPSVAERRAGDKSSASALLASAPSASGDAAPSAPVCDGGLPSQVAELNPGLAVDSLLSMIVETEGEVRIEAAIGEPCAEAADRETCEAAVAALPTDDGFEATLPRHYFAYTRGDEVGVVANVQELTAFLVPIDTFNEAALLFWAHGYGTQCRTFTQSSEGYSTSFMAGSVALDGCRNQQQLIDLHVTIEGVVTETATQQIQYICVGRRPDGLRPDTQAAHDVGAYFARVAYLELAAAAAFVFLESELCAHGAPPDLLLRTRKAAADELRHARATADLAREHGAEPNPLVLEPRRRRGVLEIALENTREGVVRELYGAAAAAWQALAAEREEVRRCWREIAREEAEHAALSLDLDAWLWSRLNQGERALVEAERRRSFSELEGELMEPVAHDVSRIAGVPRPADAGRLLAATALVRA